jgi:hypothetical protein
VRLAFLDIGPHQGFHKIFNETAHASVQHIAAAIFWGFFSLSILDVLIMYIVILLTQNTITYKASNTVSQIHNSSTRLYISSSCLDSSHVKMALQGPWSMTSKSKCLLAPAGCTLHTAPIPSRCPTKWAWTCMALDFFRSSAFLRLSLLRFWQLVHSMCLAFGAGDTYSSLPDLLLVVWDRLHTTTHQFVSDHVPKSLCA